MLMILPGGIDDVMALSYARTTSSINTKSRTLCGTDTRTGLFDSALKIIDEIAKSGAKLKILKVQLLVKTIIKRIKYFNLLY